MKLSIYYYTLNSVKLTAMEMEKRRIVKKRPRARLQSAKVREMNDRYKFAYLGIDNRKTKIGNIVSKIDSASISSATFASHKLLKTTPDKIKIV